MNYQNEIKPYIGMKVRFNNDHIDYPRDCYINAHGKVHVIYDVSGPYMRIKMDGNPHDSWDIQESFRRGIWTVVPNIDSLTDPEYEDLFI